MTVADVLSGASRWCVVQGDLREVLLTMPDGCVDHVITDPPYSEQVHRSVRSSRRNGLPDAAAFACCTRRVVDLGFAHLDDDTRQIASDHVERLVRRWALVFSDIEHAHEWREALVDGRADPQLRYKRTGVWRRLGGAPQFTGDKPAAGVEAITMVHRKGRSRWNGGGHAAVYEHAIVANRLGERGSRVHPTQKPEPLMLELVALFTDPDDIILDPFCGSGTTGVAALRLGRRFVGVELQAEHVATARERLGAEERGSTLQAARAGQTALFGGTP